MTEKVSDMDLALSWDRQTAILKGIFPKALELDPYRYINTIPFVSFFERINVGDIQVIVDGRLPLAKILSIVTKKVDIVCGYETKDLENWKDGDFAGKEPYVAQFRIGRELKERESDATLLEGIFVILMNPKTLEEGEFLLLMGSKMKDYVAAIRKIRGGHEVFPVLPEDVNNPKFKRLKRVK